MKFVFVLSMLIAALVATVVGAPASLNDIRDHPDVPLFPASTPSKPITSGDPAPGNPATKGYPIVELFSGKDYTLNVYRMAYRDMLGGQCLNVGQDINSIKMWDMDIEYWCRIYGQLDCKWDSMIYADLPGAIGYFVNDLRKSWDRKMGSIQCWPGQFEEWE